MAETKNESKTPAEGPVAKTPEENPKVVAPAGTVPTAMAAPGPSLPHPSTDKPDPTSPTAEVAAAKARAAGSDPDENMERTTPVNIGEPYGEPIQCIARRKFQGERGETVRAGAVYWYTRRKNVVWPDYLEPVNKAVATKVKKEIADYREDRQNRLDEKRKARETLARMATAVE